jgi:hypothetical protein
LASASALGAGRDGVALVLGDGGEDVDCELAGRRIVAAELRTNTDLNPLETMLCYKQLWTTARIMSPITCELPAYALSGPKRMRQAH